MAEQDGTLQVVKVPVSSVPTALLYEITSELTINNSSKNAVNKGSSSFMTKVLTNQEWGVAGRAHLDETANPALDVIRNAAVAKTKLVACQCDSGATGWKASGDAYINQFGMSGPVESFVEVSFNLLGTGAVAFT